VFVYLLIVHFTTQCNCTAPNDSMILNKRFEMM